MIDKTAIIDPKAKVSSNVSVGAYTIIGPNVEIGENSIIQSHVSIVGNTKIGKGNKIYSFASIGLILPEFTRFSIDFSIVIIPSL